MEGLSQVTEGWGGLAAVTSLLLALGPIVRAVARWHNEQSRLKTIHSLASAQAPERLRINLDTLLSPPPPPTAPGAALRKLISKRKPGSLED